MILIVLFYTYLNDFYLFFQILSKYAYNFEEGEE